MAGREDYSRSTLRTAILREHKKQKFDVIEWPDFDGMGPVGVSDAVEVSRLQLPGFIHAEFTGGWRYPRESFERSQLRKTGCWVAPSRWIQETVSAKLGYLPLRTAVVPNPIDMGLFNTNGVSRNLFDDRVTVLFAGSFQEKKGVLKIAEAANVFLAKLPRADLIFVGSSFGDMHFRIMSRVDGKLQSRVRILHPLDRSGLSRLMKRASIFLMPSSLESFGNVFAEAMACGLPVVAGNTTSTPEVVPHREAGILVDPQDVMQIASAVTELAESPELRQRMGAFSSDFAASKYSLSRVAVQNLDFYAECLRSRSNA
jgi:glycosyltransferase involved in cell wall biosynthesis